MFIMLNRARIAPLPTLNTHQVLERIKFSDLAELKKCDDLATLLRPKGGGTNPARDAFVRAVDELVAS